MATLKKELRDILDRYGIDPRDKSQIWDCHGTLVLYHKAYEVIAAKEGITFDPPIVLEANGAAKSVALCVVAQMGDRIEWSTGEAAPGNNKNAYPYAMAEKRAKDRVVGKLVGLAAYVLSEDEADDFKTGERRGVDDDDASNPPAHTPKAPTGPQTDTKSARTPAMEEFFKRASYEISPAKVGGIAKWDASFKNALAACKTLDEMCKLEEDNRPHLRAFNDTANAAVTESLRQFLVAQEDRLKIGMAA
jgi:hypothetical protein